VRRRPWVSFLLATGLNVSLTLLSAYLSLIATEGNVFSSVVVALLVFLIGLAVTIQLELRLEALKLQRRIEDDGLRLQAGMNELNLTLHFLGRLAHKIERLPDLRETYLEIIANANTAIEKFSGTAVEQECRRLVTQVQTELKELARGILLVDSFDPELKSRLLYTPNLHLRTTSLTRIDLEFYTHPDGRNYWNEQKLALAERRENEDAAIERIFIWDKWSTELANLINEHLAAGVRVLIVPESRLPDRDRVDVTFWGDKYTFRQHARQRPEGSGIWFDRFSINYSDIEEAQATYKRIRNFAKLLEHPASPDGPP
jgi:hypothetical protein